MGVTAGIVGFADLSKAKQAGPHLALPRRRAIHEFLQHWGLHYVDSTNNAPILYERAVGRYRYRGHGRCESSAQRF